MKFTSTEDIEAPIEAVFREIADFRTFERAARRHGAEVRRTDALSVSGPGMGWHVRFVLRERAREMDIALVTYEPPTGIVLTGDSSAITGQVRVDLVAVAPGRTRFGVDLTVEARSLAGRIMMQPFKLMRGNMTRRFRLRVADFAADVEDRFKRHA